MIILLDIDLADRRIPSELEECRHDHLDDPGDDTLRALQRHEARFTSVYSSLVRQAIREAQGGL